MRDRNDLGAFDITTILPQELVQKVEQVVETVKPAAQTVPATTSQLVQQPAPPAAPKPSILKRYGPVVGIGALVLGAFWAAKKYLF